MGALAQASAGAPLVLIFFFKRKDWSFYGEQPSSCLCSGGRGRFRDSSPKEERTPTPWSIASVTHPANMSRSSQSTRRRAATLAMKRSASAPALLAPVWEPDEEEYDDQQPDFLNTAGSLHVPDRASPRSVCDSEDDWTPPEWVPVLASVGDIAKASQQLSHYELLVAAQASLRHNAGALRLESGFVDHAYIIKRLLVAGKGFKVVEGIERTTRKNFCLKIIPGGKVRGLKPLEAMQSFHLVASFVEEVRTFAAVPAADATPARPTPPVSAVQSRLPCAPHP